MGEKVANPFSSLRCKLISYTPEVLWVFIGQAGTAIAGLFGVKVLTNLLGPGEFGKLALATTVVALISTNFLFGPLGQGLIRFWPIARERGELGVFYQISNRYGIYATGLSIGMTIVLVVVAMSLKGVYWAPLLMIAMSTGIASGWLGLRRSVFLAARQRRRGAILDIGVAFSKPIVAASLVLMIAVNALWAMAGYLLATFVIVLVAEHFYRRTVSDTVSLPLVEKRHASVVGKNILSFSWPFAVWGFFSWIHFSSDRWSLQAFYGADVVGVFAVVAQLAIFPLIFGSSFLNAFFYPIANQRVGDLTVHHSVTSAHKILIIMTGLYITGAVILITLFSIFHSSLVLLISNVNFVKFSALLPGLTGAWALFFLGQVLSTFGMLANQPQSYIMPKIVSSIIASIGTFYLSAKVGPVGVVWALAVAGLFYALWCGIIALQLIKGNNGNYIRENK